MLDGDKQRLQVGRETGSAHFCAGRTAVKVFRRPTCRAFRVDRPNAVAATVEVVRVAIGRDPEPAHRIESAIVRAGEPAVRAGQMKVAPIAATDGSPHCTEFPTCISRPMVAVRRRQLKNMAVLVVGTRVGGIDLLGLACRVLGQQHVNLPGLGIGLDVFRPVELGRTQKIGRASRLHDHIGLAVEPVGRIRGPCPNTSGSHSIVPSPLIRRP